MRNTPGSQWRDRLESLHGREEIVAYLTRKWQTEFNHRLIKKLWTSSGNRIRVRFAYKWHMTIRHDSINEVPLHEFDRLIAWSPGRRLDDGSGLTQVGL